MKFILTLILIYFIFSLVSRLVVRYLLRKSSKLTEDGAFKGNSSESSRKHKKVFKKDDGEYVDFEEMKKK
jgi:hypothetical protein